MTVVNPPPNDDDDDDGDNEVPVNMGSLRGRPFGPVPIRVPEEGRPSMVPE